MSAPKIFESEYRFCLILWEHEPIKSTELAKLCKEKLDWEFVKYIWNFNKNNRVLNRTRIAKSKHAKAYVLKNRKEKQAFLASLGSVLTP